MFSILKSSLRRSVAKLLVFIFALSIPVAVSARAEPSIPALRSEAAAAKAYCREALGKRDGLIQRGKWVCFAGHVPTDAALRKLLKALSRSNIFVVRSMGGEVRSALDVGEVLARRGQAVVVLDHCLSACANYWFLGAKYKFSGKDDGVGFHGGPPGPDDCHETAETCANLTREYARSNAFLRKAGVDPIILYSPPPTYDLANRATSFWTFSRTELLAKWHVPNVVEYEFDPR